MNIVLAEILAGGQMKPEKSYGGNAVRIGRDPVECQIIFDSAQFPMVSRKHAELHLQNGQWVLHDLNSSYGTFYNGQKISAPQIVVAGSSLQFGTNGPTFRVVRFEDANQSSGQLQQSYATGMKEQNFPPQPKTFPPQNQPSTQTAQLDFVGRNAAAQPFKITKNSIWIGRDPNGDIVLDADAVMVSRRHAEIRNENGAFLVYDNGSFNGTLVNDQRISAPTPLYHNDQIQLGMGGPVLRFNMPSRIAPKGASHAGQRGVAASQMADLNAMLEGGGSKTMVFKAGDISQQMSKNQASVEPSLLMSLTFGSKQELVIGRAESCDITLDGLQISNQHARLVRTASGVDIEDLNSTNGVFIDGNRITRRSLTLNDSVQIGSFILRIDQAFNIGVYDTRSKTRIDSVNITKEVKNRSGGGMIRLLDDVSLSIMPNEFVGLLGPSGAGKSTFMDALNGMRPASSGNVLVNNADLYQNLDAIKQSIGYVPQDDIIHRELTVYRTLYYVAKLRLSGDVSRKEIDQIVDEVMDVTGLSERRDVPINQLSGGQRKRVSIAVELVTKPSVIYLDEPTSGLDPATEEKIMVLFRQIAESGRTVILTTHAMENVKLFDKIVLLMRGKLVFYGDPQEALNHVGAKSFKELYDKIEAPIEERLKNGGNRHQITEQVAEEWKQKFMQTPQYRKNVYEPLSSLGNLQGGTVNKKRSLGIFGSIRQFFTLSRRYWEVLMRDKLNLAILFLQAPIVAFLTFLVMDDDQPRDFLYFVLSLVAVWFGTSVAAREIIRERAVYNRERMVNLGLIPYVFSKLFILGIVVGLQCVLLFLPLKFFDVVGLMDMPGILGGIPQFWIMLLVAAVGISLGLLISALVKTSEMATSLVPLILIPQILFSGLVGIPYGLARVGSMIMPASWAFDTMKRFSDLPVLREEDDKDKKKNCAAEPCGLYEKIESDNDKIIADAKNDINKYKDDAKKDMDNYKDDMETYQRNLQSGISSTKPTAPTMKEVPKIKDAVPIPKDLSGHVDFLHPWMNDIVNQIILMMMFLMLVMGTLIVLRMQDIG
jgi:ABC transport system ATP-binding/permease protein